MSTRGEHQGLRSIPLTPDGGTSKQLEISNAVVRIYKRYLGRGPRSARTQLTDDMAIVMLTGCLTQAERSLHEAGQHELLMSQRHAIQRLMADEMIATVRSILGRDVISFMSTSDPEKEIGVELFVLDGGRPGTVAGAGSGAGAGADTDTDTDTDA